MVNVVFILGLIVWALVAARMSRPLLGDAVDDGQYLVGALSMRAGTGYRLVSRVGSPVARKYPPGTSTLTLLAMELVPGRPTLVKDAAVVRVLMLGCAILFAIGSYRLFLLMGLGSWCSALLGLAVLFYPLVLGISEVLNSDLPFAMISIFLLCRWAYRWQKPGSAGLRAWLVDGCLVAAAMVIRGNGFTLLLAGAAAWWLGKPKRSLAQLGVFAGIPIAVAAASMLLIASQKGHADTGFYGSELVAGYSTVRHVWDIPLSNIERMPIVFTWAVWPMAKWTMPIFRFFAHHAAIRIGLGILVMAAAAVGLIPTFRRKLGPAAAVLLVLTLMVYAVWYFPFDVRYVFPILPLILGGFILAVRYAGSALGASSRLTPIVAAVVLAGAVAPSGSLAYHAARHNWKTAAGLDPDEVAAFTAIQRVTPSDAVVFARIPELIYLYTGRQSAPLIDDVSLAAGKPPAWHASLHWLTAASGHPIYIFGTPPTVSDDWRGAMADDSTDATDTFVNSAPYVIQTVYLSPHDHFWLGRLTDRPKELKEPRTK
jgi:hypothetical protein